MRHRTIPAISLIIATAAFPSHASNVRRTDGLVIVPSVTVAGVPASDAARCHFLAGGNEVFGKVTPLTEHESDGSHLFELRDGEMGSTPPPTNFDLVFYEDLGSCDPSTLRLPAPARPIVHATPGNEKGAIPAGARFAVVTATNGVNVSFLFIVFG